MPNIGDLLEQASTPVQNLVAAAGGVIAWRDAFSTDFADNVYEYFALMRVQLRAFRSQRKDEFLRFDREKQQAIVARNWALLDSVLEKFEGLADAFAQADDLTAAERSVFVLRHYNQLSTREAAEALDRAEGTVKNLLFRALRKLRDELGELQSPRAAS